MRRSSSVLALLAAAVLFSTGGAAIKLSALGPWQVVCIRSGLAALTLWACLPGARHGYRPVALAAALPFAATLTLFVASTKYTTAANAIFLQSTAPLYLTVLAPWLLGERIGRRDLLLLGCMFVGLALVAFDPVPTLKTAPAPALGNALGALSGLTWALTVIGFRRVVGSDPAAGMPAATFVAGNVLAALLTLPAALPLPALGVRDIAVFAWLGVVQISLGYVCLGLAVRHLPALTTAMLLLLEPVLNPLWVWLLHGEAPGMRAAAGGLVILAASAAKAVASAGRPGAVPPDVL